MPLLCSLWIFNASSGQWALALGQLGANAQPEVLVAPLGVFHPSNRPQGRMCGLLFTDPDGYVWLYGGQSIGGDLWVYSPFVQQWAKVMNASAEECSTGNLQPGPRRTPYYWSDNSEHYIYGGFGTSPTDMQGDVWRFRANVTVSACPFGTGRFSSSQLCLYCDSVSFSNSSTGSVCSACPNGQISSSDRSFWCVPTPPRRRYAYLIHFSSY
jgi:hypothetical protein